eukprot:scaffold41763_cov22-Tisochrysis_lutea.AAC.1
MQEHASCLAVRCASLEAANTVESLMDKALGLQQRQMPEGGKLHELVLELGAEEMFKSNNLVHIKDLAQGQARSLSWHDKAHKLQCATFLLLWYLLEESSQESKCMLRGCAEARRGKGHHSEAIGSSKSFNEVKCSVAAGYAASGRERARAEGLAESQQPQANTQNPSGRKRAHAEGPAESLQPEASAQGDGNPFDAKIDKGSAEMYFKCVLVGILQLVLIHLQCSVKPE